MLFSKVKQKLTDRLTDYIYNKYIVDPVDNYQDREQWIQKELSKLSSGARLLDAGAGELEKKKYCEHLQYVSQDFAQYDGVGDGVGLQMGTWDQSKIDIVSDIIDIPVEDESFDAVLCVEVLEHLPDPLLAIKELIRVLKPEGKLILTAPFSSLTHFAPYHYCTGFNRYWYLEHFNRLGVKDVRIENNGNYHSLMMQELSRVRGTLEEYRGYQFSMIEDLSHRILMSRLSNERKLDEKSHELACFGYNVVVIK